MKARVVVSASYQRTSDNDLWEPMLLVRGYDASSPRINDIQRVELIPTRWSWTLRALPKMEARRWNIILSIDLFHRSVLWEQDLVERYGMYHELELHDPKSGCSTDRNVIRTFCPILKQRMRVSYIAWHKSGYRGHVLCRLWDRSAGRSDMNGRKEHGKETTNVNRVPLL